MDAKHMWFFNVFRLVKRPHPFYLMSHDFTADFHADEIKQIKIFQIRRMVCFFKKSLTYLSPTITFFFFARMLVNQAGKSWCYKVLSGQTQLLHNLHPG